MGSESEGLVELLVGVVGTGMIAGGTAADMVAGVVVIRMMSDG